MHVEASANVSYVEETNGALEGVAVGWTTTRTEVVILGEGEAKVIPACKRGEEAGSKVPPVATHDVLGSLRSGNVNIDCRNERRS